jgi:hypothetical protein
MGAGWVDGEYQGCLTTEAGASARFSECLALVNGGGEGVEYRGLQDKVASVMCRGIPDRR